MKSFRFSITPGLVSISLLLAPAAQAQLALIRQGSETRGEAESGDRFGAAVCAGDFNGDGYDDLAAGAPGEFLSFNLFFAGGYVTVNYGTPRGLTWTGTQGRGPANAGLDEGDPHEMGAALASADFNNDGFDDLAVGLPGSPVSGNFSAGRVVIFMGSASGLSSSAALVLTQTTFGGANESGDRFGAALAAGKLGNDQYADLVIGGPGENGTGSGLVGEGAVFIIRGGPGGLDTGISKFILAGTAVPGGGAANGGYGTSLAIGQLRDSAAAELAVGAPYLTVSGQQGLVLVHAANATSVVDAAGDVLTAANDTFTHSGSAAFGFSLAIGRFNPLSNPADPAAPRALAVGTGNEGTVSLARINGTQMAFYGLLNPTSSDGNGRSLAAGDFDGDGDDDLAMGQPLHTAPTSAQNGLFSAGEESGRVALRHFNGSTWAAAEYWDEADTGVLYANGALGSCLAAGHFSAGPRSSLAAGCPGADIFSSQTGCVVDISPWRQVRRPGCIGAVSVDCDGNVVYALRPFDELKVASIAKIMTVLLGCEAAARPVSDPLHVDLLDWYTIEPWCPAHFGSSNCSKWGYESAGDHYHFHDLLRTCIMVSGNDSAFCIADAMTGEIFTWNGYGATCPLFSALMNARAAEIGMTQTNFVAPSGRFGTSTAWDMSLLGRTAMQNPVFREIVSDTTELILYEHGSGADASRMCSYGWLLGLQQQDPRIIGVKPGGSDEAGRTCVVAGVPEDQPEKLAFGVGLGWFEPYNSESKRARVEIMQVGLNLCEPPPLVASSAALGDFSWALQRAGEPSTAQGTFEVTSDGARALPVDIHLVKPQATAASPRLEVKLLHELLFDLPDGRSTTFSMTGLPGHRGFTVRNTGGTPAPIIITSGGQTRLTLAPGQAHSIPPAAGPVSIRLQADGARCELTLAGVCDITPSWLQTTYAPATSVRMELPDLAVQHGWKIIACSLENLPQPFPLRVIVDEPDNLLTFPRVPDLDGLTLTPTGPTERLAFDFHGIPGLEPANGYDILGGGTLDGTWAPLARIAPAPDGRAAYHTTLSLPAASRRFLKIAPAP